MLDGAGGRAAGASYAEAVERAIVDARAMVVILTTASATSPQVRLEVRQALEQRRPIVLVRTAGARDDGPLLREIEEAAPASFADDDLALGEMAAHVQALVEIRDASVPPLTRAAATTPARAEPQTPGLAALLLKHPRFRPPSAGDAAPEATSYGGGSAAPAARAGGVVFWLSAVAVGALAAVLLWKLVGPGGLLAKLMTMSVVPNGAPAATTDQVDLSVFSPDALAPGEAVLVQALLHIVETAPGFVADLAAGADPAAIRRGAATLEVDVARGERLEIAIDCPALQIEAPVHAVTWRGRPLVAPFLVRAKAEVAQGPVQVRVSVLREGAPIGEIRFGLEIGPEPGPRETQAVGDEAKRLRPPGPSA